MRTPPLIKLGKLTFIGGVRLSIYSDIVFLESQNGGHNPIHVIYKTEGYHDLKANF